MFEKKLFKYEPCFGDFELNENKEMCQYSIQAKGRIESIGARWQVVGQNGDVTKTNKGPLIMKCSKIATKETKRV